MEAIIVLVVIFNESTISLARPKHVFSFVGESIFLKKKVILIN
jgi:hypothetical protein